MNGYWGTVTATVDWCEDNYTHTPYLAEFYNTLSNILFVLLGITGIYLTRHGEPRFFLAFCSLIVIGIGSGIFHATLLFSAQLCDELPMLYNVLTLFYICQEHENLKPKNKVLPVLLWIGGLTFTLVYVLFPIPLLFQVTWASLIIYVVSSSIRISKVVRQREALFFRTAVISLAISASLWLIDQFFCYPVTKFFKLHAIWHFGTAIAGYLFILNAYYIRTKTVQKREPVMQWNYGIFPIVVVRAN